LAESLASFFLPRPGTRYRLTQAVYRVCVFSRRGWTATASSQYVRYAPTLPCAEGTGRPRLLVAIFSVSLARASLRVVP
jgi:hypothetical protein